jgi:hypothetical protein
MSQQQSVTSYKQQSVSTALKTQTEVRETRKSSCKKKKAIVQERIEFCAAINIPLSKMSVNKAFM